MNTEKQKINDALLKIIPEEIILKGNNTSREIWVNGKLLSPRRSQVLYNHSPDGFNWGYGRSGASQLALGILAEYMPGEYALKYYMMFKWDAIALLPQADFEKTIKLRDMVRSIIDKCTLQ